MNGASGIPYISDSTLPISASRRARCRRLSEQYFGLGPFGLPIAP
jgi:hypothetical protein